MIHYYHNVDFDSYDLHHRPGRGAARRCRGVARGTGVELLLFIVGMIIVTIIVIIHGNLLMMVIVRSTAPSCQCCREILIREQLGPSGRQLCCSGCPAPSPASPGLSRLFGQSQWDLMMTMFDDGYIAVPIHGLKDDGGDGGALELFRWWRARQ